MLSTKIGFPVAKDMSIIEATINFCFYNLLIKLFNSYYCKLI